MPKLLVIKIRWLMFLDWYHILRMHRHWGVIEAIKYALWLSK